MSKPGRPVRADYKNFYPITTRWSENDIYGHVNNVTYYSYFDTAANRYLIEACTTPSTVHRAVRRTGTLREKLAATIFVKIFYVGCRRASAIFLLTNG